MKTERSGAEQSMASGTGCGAFKLVVSSRSFCHLSCSIPMRTANVLSTVRGMHRRGRWRRYRSSVSDRLNCMCYAKCVGRLPRIHDALRRQW
ncbi:hypothetical protein M5D96_009935 [Drosophila gunungcola]|uniref:Uncharacterized protein n=1 Tax=Drosophila gunungcola TaxID=103775 RepID=A0A9P9YI24_9MUSC|nr:hypothetical protein M5D96_009935 [Drosophila gunungcola]